MFHVLIVHQFEELGRGDLPGDAVAVLHPAGNVRALFGTRAAIAFGIALGLSSLLARLLARLLTRLLR